MLNGAVTYSNPCNKVKNAAKPIVQINAFIASGLFPQTIAWCAQVTVAPELNKIIVFNKGTFQGFKTIKNAGGQTPPIAKLGLKLE